MNQMHTPTTTSTVGMFTTGDITPETVISDLFTGTVSSLPQWDSSSYVSTTAPTSSVTACKEELRQSEGGSEGAYDTMHGSSNEESGGSLPLTPPTSDSGPRSSASRHSSEHLSNTDDLDQPLRKKRHPIPEEKKDAKYWERRRKNNVAAKRSREMRRKKTDDELKTAREAIQENQKLKQEVEVLKAEINSLRRLLKDANMTLSLWIRARQTSEPPAQLPPMLRGGNVSFVNFPVSTTV